MVAEAAVDIVAVVEKMAVLVTKVDEKVVTMKSYGCCGVEFCRGVDSGGSGKKGGDISDGS